MSRTWDEMKQLRHRVQKVEDLRNKEEQHRFAKMSQNRNDGKRHSGKIAKCVADKNACWIPVKKKGKRVQ